MPTGVLINTISIFLGGIIGARLKDSISHDFKMKMNLVLGVCSMGMGIQSITLMENMSAVIFAILIGTAIGLACHLGEWIRKGAICMQKPIAKLFPVQDNIDEADFLQQLVTIIVLFCASGTGIYGSLTAGMTQDNTILISKSVLDFFTAAIFACNLGYVVSVISIPQFLIFYVLFLFAGFLCQITTPTMINDFKACGGFLMLATGFRMMKLKDVPTADMIPAMLLIMPFSYLWSTYIVHLL